MPFIREMSREKIRKREKYPPKKSSGGRRVQGKRGELGLCRGCGPLLQGSPEVGMAVRNFADKNNFIIKST
jgi:hypothetical protein